MVTDAMRPAIRQALGTYAGTATKLIFPDALALTNDNNKSFIVANADGEIINSSGNQVAIQVFYPEGSAEEEEDIYFNLESLQILAAAGLNNSGVPFAETSVTLNEYNSTQVAQLSTEWEW